jgi:hypothetical protein
MARFSFPGQYSMKVLNKKSLLAFFTFVDRETGLEFKDWRLQKRNDGSGFFVTSPDDKYFDKKENKDKYIPYVRVALTKEKERCEKGEEFMAELCQAALAEYRRRGDGSDGAEEKDPPRSSRSSSGGKSSGGKMDYEKMFPADDDDDLPF